MKIQHFFDPQTCTLTYAAYDEASRKAVVFDSVLDFDAKSGRTWEESIENAPTLTGIKPRGIRP